MNTVKFDNALNEAGWVMINELQKHGEVNGSMFNAMKTCLSSAIGTYLLFKEAEAPTETPKEKEALDAIERVEWNGEGLPPVGVECEMIFDGKGKLITPLYFTDFVDGLVLFYHSSNSMPHCDDTYDWCLVENCIFRKPETPEAKKEREEFIKLIKTKFNNDKRFIDKTMAEALFDAGCRFKLVEGE